MKSNTSGENKTPQIAEQSRPSAINLFFIFFVAGAVLLGALQGNLAQVNVASVQSAKTAVKLALDLIGVMAFWLGMVRILEASGLMRKLAGALRPLMTRLFPEVPAEHPAMGAMLLNIAANMLGLANAATPFGIKAMIELEKLNPFPGTATNAMCLFLAINTSSVTLLPLGVINLRASEGSLQPAAVFLPTLIATLSSTFVGAVVALSLGKLDRKYRRELEEIRPKGQGGVAAQTKVKSADGTTDLLSDEGVSASAAESVGNGFSHLLYPVSSLYRYLSLAFLGVFVGCLVVAGVKASSEGRFSQFFMQDVMSTWLMPSLILLIILYGMMTGVKIYEAVTEGAKQGFDTAVRIIPYLVAMLVGVEMFTAAGGMKVVADLLDPVTSLIGLPTKVLPVALVRSLSGSGAFALVAGLVHSAPNSFEAYLASTMMGAHDTTFYILAVYFGAVGVVRIRYALVAGILADITGTLVSCLVCHLLW